MVKHKAKRACLVCGKSFFGGSDHFYCPECARAKKLDTVVKIRSCQDCGVEFYGGPRARRCPYCAYKARQEISRQHKKTGTKRPIGSVDKCAVCGKEYVVTSGRQKYCSPAYQRIGVLEWQRERKKGYNKASGQDAKKQDRRKEDKKICAYCGQVFTSNTSTNLCSNYCRQEQRKITQCMADIKRGYHQDLEKYLDKRKEYRDKQNKCN